MTFDIIRGDALPLIVTTRAASRTRANRLADWRCNDRRQLAAALQVDKPEPVPEDQLDLFGGVG